MADPKGLDAFMRALSSQESGDNPTAENERTGAHGTYQILPSNWPAWSREAGLGANAARTAENQYQVARFKMAQYYRQFGSWEAVAVAWYAGPGAAQEYVKNPNQTRFTRGQGPNGTEPSIQSYVNTAMSGMGRAASTPQSAAPTSGGTTVATAAAKPKSQQELLDYIAENYPDVYGLLNIDPEVKSVLLTAARKEYTAAKLRSELAKTKWWKTTAATARSWDASYAQDRATGDQLLKQTQTEIAAQATRIGVSLTAAQLNTMSLNVRRLGWTQQQVAESLAAYWRKASKPAAGAGTATVDTLRAIMADYGVQMSDSALEGWTQRIIGGKADEAGFRSYVIKQAKSLFPSVADDISEGQTVRDYFDPYVQMAARVLGVNPEDVNLSDTKWRRALVQLDPATGKRVPMTLDAWEAELRTNTLYGFDRTTNGRAAAAEFGSALRAAVGQ